MKNQDARMRSLADRRRTWRQAAMLAVTVAIGAPAIAHATPAEEANKKLVLDFYAALNAADASGTMKARIQGIAETYLSPEYHQHSAAYAALPGAGSERDRLVRMFQSIPPRPGAAPVPKTVAIMAEKDLVMMLTSRDAPGQNAGAPAPTYIFNMFRIRDGKLAEHWDVMPGGREPPPPAPGAGAPPPDAAPRP